MEVYSCKGCWTDIWFSRRYTEEGIVKRAPCDVTNELVDRWHALLPMRAFGSTLKSYYASHSLQLSPFLVREARCSWKILNFLKYVFWYIRVCAISCDMTHTSLSPNNSGHWLWTRCWLLGVGTLSAASKRVWTSCFIVMHETICCGLFNDASTAYAVERQWRTTRTHAFTYIEWCKSHVKPDV
jgi:hypothetical protein